MNKSKFKSILILILTAFLSYSFYQEIYLSKQIQERDEVIKKMNNIELNRGNKVDTLIEVAEKKINFYIDNKKVTTDEFINFTNKLQSEILILKDSLEYYKTYYNMTFNKGKEKFVVERGEDKITYSYIGHKVDLDSANTTIRGLVENINEKRDSIQNLNFNLKLHKDIIKKYGITVNVLKTDSNFIEYNTIAPKIDSALMIYPYYKDKLYYDKKEKEWKIETPK